MHEIFFNSAEGRVEARYNLSKYKRAPSILLLHSNPVYGGSIDTPLIQKANEIFVNNHFNTLMINFSEAGKSQGKFSNGIKELIDAAIAVDWMHSNFCPINELWIFGFSFGAWVCSQLIMRRPAITNFVIVSPPVNKYDFSFFSQCSIKGLIAHGTLDSVTSTQCVIDLLSKNKNKSKILYCSIEEADHFFRFKLDDLEKIINEYINQNIKFKITSTS